MTNIFMITAEPRRAPTAVDMVSVCHVQALWQKDLMYKTVL